ncbi:MAG: SMC-Scp complex subunit ScpB [Elusimicrobia bacterium]|nr:SMC-Scp complex subunit ScpB [Elusimicrobiota bacterium]
METAELKTTIETLLFITEQPIPLPRLCKLVGVKDLAQVSGLVQELKQEYEARGAGIQVLEIAEGFQMATKPAQAPFVRKLYADKMTMKLSTAALETLSIVAYKQPITRAEIEQIRGVEVIAALETLLERRLLKVVGRKETVGRPLLYGTTPDFLRHFGLKSIADLPSMDSFTPAETSHPDLSEEAWQEAGSVPAEPPPEAGAAAAAPAAEAAPAPGAAGPESPAFGEAPAEETPSEG